jgi:hypothetical protein
MTRVWLSLIVGIILIFSAVTLGGYNNFVSAQLQNRITLSNGAIITPVLGQCRGWNDVKPHIYLVTEHCAIPAPSNQPIPPNPCSDKPGTIFWPSSGGCVPENCPPGAKHEIRGARLNSGECDPNFGSGPSGSGSSNSNPNNQTTNAANNNNQLGADLGALPTALGATFGPFGIRGVEGPVPVVSPGSTGVVPAEPPVYEGPIQPPLPDWWPPEPSIPNPPIVVPGEAAAEGGAAAAEGGAALVGEGGATTVATIGAGAVAGLAAGAVAAFAVGWWIGCGGEFC